MANDRNYFPDGRLKPCLYGRYDTNGEFSYWFTTEEYEPQHSEVFSVATRERWENDEMWRHRANKKISKLL